MSNIELLQGDCLELMKDIPDKSVDMILCDLPYGTTACVWDIAIPFNELWESYERIIKDNGAICLFGSEPFSSKLRLSNLKYYKYDWIWKKTRSGNFPQAKNMPLKIYENISVFSKGVCVHKGQSKKRMNYFPQGVKEVEKTWHRPQINNTEHKYRRPSNKTDRTITGENYPRNILEFPSVYNNTKKLHPTQKPIALLEYLIKTYTNEGDLVLDNCMGSGSTGVACMNTDRDFIGMELDENYFKIAEERIKNYGCK